MCNDQNGTFTALSSQGLPKSYRLLFTVTLEETDTCYVVYTDDSLTPDGETRVFASIYEPDEAGGFLLPIETDWEWNLLEHLLNNGP